MDPAPTPATGNSQQILRPRVLLLTDATILSMGFSDLLKERVELRIMEAGRPAEEITTAITQWQPDVILLTSRLASPLPCLWEWARLLKYKNWYVIRFSLQDNSVDICHVQTVTIAHLGDLLELITARPASNTHTFKTGASGRQ